MPITNIQSSNTIDEFRLAFNDAANAINSLSGGGFAGGVVTANVTANNLTSGRVTIVGTSGIIQDDAGLTYNPTTDVLTVAGGVVTANVTANNLTSGRVALVGSSGIIQDDSGMTYNPTTDILTLSGTTDSFTPLDGTLVVSGGVGIAKTLRVSGNTYISGNLVILGSNTELSTTQININDPLLQLANNNTSDLIDIGLFGQYNQGAANLHSGIFRDSNDGIWKLFKSYSAEPTTKISTSANNFAYADLAIASLTSNANGSFGGTLTVSGGIVTANVTANNLTSGRVAIVGTSGIIQDDSGLTYNTTTDVLTASGGIVTANVTANNLTLSNALTVANGGTGVTTSTGSGNNVLSDSPTLVTPILGTPASGNLTNCTFPTLNQNTTGTAAGLSATLAVGSGGTGVTTSTGSGNNVLSNTPTLVSPILGTPTSGNLTNCTFPTLNQNTSGTAAGLSSTLAVSSGGTGLSSTPANGALDIGNGTGFTRTTLSPGTGISITNSSGGITITNTSPSSGGTVTSVGGTGTVQGLTLSGTVTGSGNLTLGGSLSAIALGSQVSGTLGVANGGTGVTSSTGSGSVVLSTSPSLSSPSLTTPALGTPSSGTLTNCTFPTLNQNTTGSAATFTSTSQNSQFNSIGVGTAASATTGEIRATNNITAYYSDDRLKTRLGNVESALDKVSTLDAFYYEANEVAQSLGYEPVREVGISAQQVQAVMPEVVAPAPIDEQYLTVRYERLVPLLIAAIKELKAEVEELKGAK